MSSASLPTARKRPISDTHGRRTVLDISQGVRLMVVLEADQDIDFFSDSGSDTESENEYESVPRFKRQKVAEDELAYRPTNGYGQGPGYISKGARSANLTRFPLKPMYNVTIPFAQDLVGRCGYDIQQLPLPQRAVIEELLAAGERQEKQAEQAAAQSTEATAASSNPPPRQRAKHVFPGEIPVGKKPLNWGRNEKAEGMAGHYTKLQFQRPLYDEGFEVADLRDKSNLELAKMWHKYRDEHYPLQGIGQQEDDAEDDDEASNVLDGLGDSFKGAEAQSQAEATTGTPISMAAMYSPQESGSLEGHINAGSSTRDLTDSSGTIRTTASDLVPTQTNDNSTLPKPLRQTVGPLGTISNHPVAATVTGKPAALQSVPQTSTRGSGKGQHAQETARRVALAARVDRYPLHLQGNNNHTPFSMDLDLAPFTIKSKYNRNMTEQLLKDYGLLPASHLKQYKTHLQLAQYLVDRRDELVENGATLQEPWTNDRLEQYVADQEAQGSILPASSLPGAGPTNAQISQLLPPQKSKSGTAAKVVTSATKQGVATTKKRNREDEDHGLNEVESPPQKRSRKMAKTKKRSREEVDQGLDQVESSPQARPRKMAKTKKTAQVTSEEPDLPSAFVATDYGSPFQHPLLPHETANVAPSASSAYASSPHHVAQHEPTRYELHQQTWARMQQPIDDPAYGQPQYGVQPPWSYTEQPVYDQQPAYQGYTIYNNGYQRYQAPPPPPQAPVSAYTMPPSPGASDMIHSPTSNIPIDPALLQ
ncbi:uncharacterized protein N0V89_006886 [Didymosphaeria variabile]|uniref:Uncharacterized protein n=1 Tax=Didymosphaeria variabile TaxID=1932322 RepID=A0A9W8XK02_9PLEO|nr:uncharacterized protein N0V89_006886 [Didymosphaeria variabile]KAJ4351543.1 hypothetical protein N0V89_006886 [Didymosphaeria variabile]